MLSCWVVSLLPPSRENAVVGYWLASDLRHFCAPGKIMKYRCTAEVVGELPVHIPDQEVVSDCLPGLGSGPVRLATRRDCRRPIPKRFLRPLGLAGRKQD